MFEGVFGLLGGIIAFGAKLYSISTALSLDSVLSAITAIKEIVNQVKAAEQNTAQQDRKISWNTLQQLSDSMGPLERL